jgi:hypothetical protein
MSEQKWCGKKGEESTSEYMEYPANVEKYDMQDIYMEGSTHGLMHYICQATPRVIL